MASGFLALYSLIFITFVGLSSSISITQFFKKMLKQSILLTMLLFSGLFAHAQMTDMHWDTHGVGFKVPSDVRITTNNAEEFSAENSNVVLSIIPIQDGNLTAEHMADATIEMAKGVGYDSVDEGDAIDIDDFTGYYVKGTKDGVNAVVMALLDKKSSTNLLVVIVYNDGFEGKAVEIAGSFYAYD